MSERHLDKNEARKRLKKYTKEEIAESLYEALVEGVQFDDQVRAKRNSDFTEDMYRIAEGAYNIRGTKLGKRSKDDREIIQNRYKGGRYANEYNGYRKRIEGTVTYEDILWVLMKYPQGIPEGRSWMGGIQPEDVPDYKPFEEILWEYQNGISQAEKNRDVSLEGFSEKNNPLESGFPTWIICIILVILLLIFRRQILGGIGTLLGYLIPIGLFAAVIGIVFRSLNKGGSAKSQSDSAAAYRDYYLCAVGIAVVMAFFHRYFFYFINEFFSAILLLAAYASVIYAVILLVRRLVLHKGKVSDIVKKLNILYCGYIFGVLILSFLSGMVDAGSWIMIAIYLASVGIIAVA